MVSSITETGDLVNQGLWKLAVAADGQLPGILDQNILSIAAGGSLLAAPIAFSGDGLNVYMAIPNEAVSAPVPRRSEWLHFSEVPTRFCGRGRVLHPCPKIHREWVLVVSA